ncbi:MAG: hypothetical protein ABSC31_06035 [Acidimicrobiales bacterium]|jgi:phosphoribosyl 1,2-cyclic phosphodiesterase
MRIWIFGVRGSTPTPGPEFVRYGGHTSCLAVALDGERPSLIVDAGTGIRLASDLFKGSPDLFNGRPYEGAILLGHMHWDHTQGLPFFAVRCRARRSCRSTTTAALPPRSAADRRPD